MEFKVASTTEIHNFLENYPGTKSVVWIDDNYTKLILAIENQRISGFTFVFKRLIPAPVGDVFELFINVIDVFDTENHKKGIGSQLVNKVKEIAKQEGVIQIRAYCDINNVSSHRLWLKNGFGICPVKESNGDIVGSFVTYRL